MTEDLQKKRDAHEMMAREISAMLKVLMPKMNEHHGGVVHAVIIALPMTAADEKGQCGIESCFVYDTFGGGVDRMINALSIAAETVQETERVNDNDTAQH